VPLTVADLLRTPGLDVRPVAGSQALRNPIRWVHVSELEDPTPWLKGGELLLTTGMGVGRTPAAQRAYVRRLSEARLAGLGLGTGFTFRTVPKAVVGAGDAAGFPIFEVPYAVPFIAITEVVFTRLVAEQYDLLSRSLEAEHTLTKAVLEGQGIGGVVSALSKATGGWAVLFDLHGSLMAVEPKNAETYVPRLWSELQTPRAEGLRFGLSVVDFGQHISLQPVTAQGRVEAFLGVGKRDALTQFDRIVASHALALLALELAKVRAVSETERRLKGDVLDKILAGELHPEQTEQALHRLGFDPGRPVAAVTVAGVADTESLAATVEEALAHHAVGPFLAAPREDVVLALIQPSSASFLADVRAAVAERSGAVVFAGAGSLVPLDSLEQTVRESRYALQVCRTEGRLHAEFEDLGTYQLLLSLQDPDALRTFADSVLAPVDRYDRTQNGELLSSLKAFLERNARWEAAAADLLVHRHTLRYRMRKVEELTGRRLSSARDRMEFFLAIRARDLLASQQDRRLSRPYNGNGGATTASPSRGVRQPQ
jgi:PucR family transcriptional regulator, purine catabolism regulatory protein